MQQIPDNNNQQYELTIDESTESKYMPYAQEKDDIANIPQYAIAALARSLLPIIQKHFESEENKREFEEWEAQEKIKKIKDIGIG